MRLPMSFRLTPAAEDDVLAIYSESKAAFGIRQAERYYQGLIACFGLLAGQPRMARQRLEFDPPFRAHFHASHVIAYVETAEGILILRVFHAHQDWPNLM
ncbi:MAG TPA: type II toxin-antitoxin system RelE/ParE family toxin [Bosea sp. (in: a-proteobacteria)]